MKQITSRPKNQQEKQQLDRFCCTGLLLFSLSLFHTNKIKLKIELNSYLHELYFKLKRPASAFSCCPVKAGICPTSLSDQHEPGRPMKRQALFFCTSVLD